MFESKTNSQTLPLLEIPESEIAREDHVRLYCEQCNKPRDFIFRNLQYKDLAAFYGFPVLWCEDCKTWAIPGNLRFLIVKPIEWAKENGKFERTFNPDGGLAEVDYSHFPEFKFSSTDYMFYPGLWRPWQNGDLTPVFFKRRVLHRYSSDPDYDLHYTSNSYGTVVIPPGHHIAFGVNRQGLVIMWLCEIAKLPADEIHYLQSENVESDHDLISDFYRGQIEAESDYTSQERMLLEAHQKLSEKFKAEWNVRFSSYNSDEIIEVLQSFAEPAIWTFKELGNIWQAMNHVLVECLNVTELKALVKTFDPAFETKNLKGLKLLEKVLSCAMVGVPADAISPFFVLYDLRIVASHKVSSSSQETLKYCYERLGMDPQIEDLKALHTNLVKCLLKSYETIIACEMKEKATPSKS